MPGIIKTISFIGAGNVATHLAQAFHSAGFSIGGIYSRRHASALALAQKVGGMACTEISGVLQGSQLVVVAVPDHAFSMLIDSLAPGDVTIVHTCGTLEMNVFSGKATHFGVLYPLQTFSQSIDVELKNVPFCIEASDKETLKRLRQVASSVSGHVAEIDSDRRKILHLAAVFACNFSNEMFAIAGDILKDADLPFSLLHPLILETARKATIDQPWNVQTGPARRSDIATIKTHEAMLINMAAYKEIYSMLSNAVSAHYRTKKDHILIPGTDKQDSNE